jgi:serine/threonine protein kinase
MDSAKTALPNSGSPTSLSKSSKETDKIGLHLFAPIQLLGEGSFGRVYLVKRISSGKLYAMKVLSKDKILKQNLTKYAYTEKNVQSSIKHPFIVRLHCSFQTARHLFMLFDYCPGGDLAHVLQHERVFTVARARLYLAEVLLALQELHNREIVYRDLKPDNVVLDADGHALLTDFGLSKEGVKDMTQSFCGSIAYLAPEVLRKSGHGKSVDWYLFGLLLYEMIVGISPYYHENK